MTNSKEINNFERFGRNLLSDRLSDCGYSYRRVGAGGIDIKSGKTVLMAGSLHLYSRNTHVWRWGLSVNCGRERGKGVGTGNDKISKIEVTFDDSELESVTNWLADFIAAKDKCLPVPEPLFELGTKLNGEKYTVQCPDAHSKDVLYIWTQAGHERFTVY